MEHAFKFDKILTIREKEKDKAFGEYKEALERFEEAAEKLYRFLKQKEDYEETYKQKLKSGLSIQDIRYFRQFVMNLERTISHYQQLVIQTREQMFLKQTKLAELNIEVKKYEKLKENHMKTVLETIQAAENKRMDEISIQQFVNRRN
ncbi:flagellar export protein FliJ [Anoxybacteroides tepidamans]|uniref:flagellar export protein FliJ n=1 Tax=Anoxybacteroides tepidamans TaxID=265948 RepID=UPI000484CC49|nr:flagellar export protein FliJ [Anoxybacillus tepidamans]